jgi:hypothetical protein
MRIDELILPLTHGYNHTSQSGRNRSYQSLYQ